MAGSEKAPEVAVRYCGGCNPTYDRVEFMEKLKRIMPGISFCGVRQGTEYPAVLLLQGCSAACATVSDLEVPASRRICISASSEPLRVRERIEAFLSEDGGRTLDRAQIEKILPHRPPMLFLDSVSRLVPGKEAVGALYLDPAWDLFRGHFPQEPVFPGFLIAEAMAQIADVMLMAQACCRGKSPLLMQADRLRLKQKLLPGETVQLRACCKKDFPEAGITVCSCQALVRDRLCAEAEITLAMR